MQCTYLCIFPWGALYFLRFLSNSKIVSNSFLYANNSSGAWGPKSEKYTYDKKYEAEKVFHEIVVEKSRQI